MKDNQLLLLKSHSISEVSDFLINNFDQLDVCHLIFDLDGTLHDFLRAATEGMKLVYKEITSDYPISINALKKHYAELIKFAEKDAFTEQKTSYQYRIERLSRLLKKFDIYSLELVERLTEIYGKTFENHIHSEHNMLLELKKLSKYFKIHIVTEGPRDAQERTINILNIYPVITSLSTSGDFGVKKENGELFSYILKDTQLTPNDVVIIGDNRTKDIDGAAKIGVRSILLQPFV